MDEWFSLGLNPDWRKTLFNVVFACFPCIHLFFPHISPPIVQSGSIGDSKLPSRVSARLCCCTLLSFIYFHPEKLKARTRIVVKFPQGVCVCSSLETLP